MPASPADIVRRHLMNLQVAVPGSPPPAAGLWPVVSGPLPPGGPDRYLSVQNTGAVQQGRLLPNGTRVESPTVMITLRAPDDPTGYFKGKDLERRLDPVGTIMGGGQLLPPVRVDGVDYVVKRVQVYSPTTKIGTEENNRSQLFSINARIDYDVMGVIHP